MKIGFTGTRNGMTRDQNDTVMSILIHLGRPFIGHHGDCEGADENFHNIVKCLQMPIVIHPPVKQDHRAGCLGASEIREPKSHFARNRDIVNETDLLIGVSVAPYRLDKGGTWYTIDYARRIGKKTIVVWPDGTTETTEAKL